MVRMRLHVLLAEYNLTQKDLAKATGIRYGTINAYTTNTFKHIVRTHVDILCTYFDCTLIELIEYKKDVD